MNSLYSELWFYPNREGEMANFAALVAALQHNGVSFQVKNEDGPIRVTFGL